MSLRLAKDSFKLEINKAMKKFITSILIVLILLPMLIYLNPFIWFMRAKPHYTPSSKTDNLIEGLNKKYNIEMTVGDVADTLWYFRDIRNHKTTKFQNFELTLFEESGKCIDLATIMKYVGEFNSQFEHVKYFDSLNVITFSDSLIYKCKMR